MMLLPIYVDLGFVKLKIAEFAYCSDSDKPFKIVRFPNFVSLSSFSNGKGSRVVILYILSQRPGGLLYFSTDENAQFDKGVSV